MSGLRFPAPGYSDLAAALLHADGLERCAIVYARYEPCSHSWLVNDVAEVPDDAYERRDAMSASLKTAFVVDVANRSRLTGMSVVMVHTHPRARGWPTFSPVDDAGETEIGAYLARRGAQVPHLAMVIARDGCRARRLDDRQAVTVWEVGGRLALWSAAETISIEQWEDRQVRAFGETGQQLLRQLHFGVIGSGGTGSLICQQLAHLGAQRVMVVDPDRVEDTNLNRLVGSQPADVGRPKVDVAARMMQTIRPSVDVQAVQADVVDEATAGALRALDIIFLCTDSHASRAVVNQIAYQYFVPVIDMGVSVTVQEGLVTHITGRVQMLAPTLACLTCTRALDGEQIRQELMTPEQRAADRYIVGEREPQPAVISINATVASLAVTMLLGAVTPVPAGPRFQRYDGIRGEVRAMAAAPRVECISCSQFGALGRGGSWELPVRRRLTGAGE